MSNPILRTEVYPGFIMEWFRGDIGEDLVRIKDGSLIGEEVFPAELVPEDYVTRFGSFSEMFRSASSFSFVKYYLNNQLWERANTPDKYGKFRYENVWTWDQYPEDRYFLPKDDGKSFPPYIAWTEESRTKDGIAGWALRIGMYPDTILGFANWSDKEGVKKLIETMKDGTYLNVLVTLLKPKLVIGDSDSGADSN